MQLIGPNLHSGVYEAQYVSYLRKDFVHRALTLTYEPAGLIRAIRFHSNDFGIAVWSNGTGLESANSWEDEDAGIDPYSLRRFRQPLLNGSVDLNFARKTILPDVLGALPRNLAAYLGRVVTRKRWKAPFPAELLAG